MKPAAVAAATVCITRYNDQTWAQRTAWLAANPGYACIYKSPVAIKSDIPYEASLFVLEMNNDTNRIMGVGRIVNEIRADRSYRMYEDQNYNRYTYLGRQRLDRAVIVRSRANARVLETLERMLFYGARHAKRGHGIHELPVRIRKNRPGFSFTHFFAELFGEPRFSAPLLTAPLLPAPLLTAPLLSGEPTGEPTGEPRFSAPLLTAPLLTGEPMFSK